MGLSSLLACRSVVCVIDIETLGRRFQLSGCVLVNVIIKHVVLQQKE